jgi:hypothetical protein
MEFEKFELSKRTVVYTCGCTKEFFGFESVTPSARCEQHDTPIKKEYNENEEL